MADLLYRRSGMLGLSGVSSDFRELVASDNPRARFAVEVFCSRVAGHIGSLAAALGGLELESRKSELEYELVLRLGQMIHSTALAGLGPAIHATPRMPCRFPWMPGTRPGKGISLKLNHLNASEH